jgi:hypothetical protein
MDSERQGSPGENGQDAAEGGERPGKRNILPVFLFGHGRSSSPAFSSGRTLYQRKACR